MIDLRRFRPSFFDKSLPFPAATVSEYRFDYGRIWKSSILIMSIVALTPLIFITLVNYVFTQRAIESEWRLKTARTVSNTHRAISFFLQERRAALDFIIAHDKDMQELRNPKAFSALLEALKKSFGGGFMDLGLINASGRQTFYEGPYDLTGKDYRDQSWFQHVRQEGMYISDVFLGYRNVPHLVIAIKSDLPDGSFYVLRASISVEPFEHHLQNLELGGKGDAFIVNSEGKLQTGSRDHGRILDHILLPIPHYSEKTQVVDMVDEDGNPLIVGYRFIEETPLILMIVKKKHDLLGEWYSTRIKLIVFLSVSTLFILGAIVGVATYMVRRIYIADERRLAALHNIEYTNKLASIGRMAASVAHEINNPLAIINENVGLIKDLFLIKQMYAQDDKLIGLIDSALKSVKRAGKITKQLLTFARNLEASVEAVHLEKIISEVLGFVQKGAELRSISIEIQKNPYIPIIETDRGKLEQILLNLINNALESVADEGHLKLGIGLTRGNRVEIRVEDDGCGIPPKNLNRIFEPFFSTKSGQGGTGLGLSITYKLIQEIGGTIQVESEVGKGTCFIITLPTESPQKKETGDARNARG